MASPVSEIQSVGVVGAGQMGNGIAHVFALKGYDVILSDLEQSALDAAIETIRGNLGRQVRKDAISESDSDAALARIRCATDLGAFEACDLVVEAASEREDVKKKIFATLLPIVPERAILTSNTSSISITRLASSTDRPEKFMGLHFMNPVPVMRLVELIRGIATDEATYDTMKKVVVSLDKEAASAISSVWIPVLRS